VTERVGSDALSAEKLIEPYVIQRSSSVVIAEQFGTSPKAVCELLHRPGITPRGGARSTRKPLLPRELLIDRYVERGLSATAIAEEVGYSPQAVRDQLRRWAIPLRPRGTASPATAALTPEVLVDLYHRQGMTLAEIAFRFGCSPSGVRKRLLRDGIPVRPRRGKRIRPGDPLSAEVLRRFYVDERLSIAAIARRLHTSRDKVSLRLRRYGIPVRAGGRYPSDPKLRETMVQLYTVEGLGVEEVASRTGISPGRAGELLRAAGIRLRPPPPRPLPPGWQPLTRELLAELYVSQRLTLAEVAERVGGSTSRVGDALRRHGIPRRPRGSRSLPGREPLTRELLVELYVNQGLGSVTIARRLGGHPSRILKALDRFGIPIRQRKRPGPIDADKLVELYVERRLSLDEIASTTGMSVNRCASGCAGRTSTALPRPS
jgi:transposase